MTRKPRAYSYVRFSTPEQSRGFSEERQLEAAAQYAADRGLELAEDGPIRDLGVSGFDGSNLERGLGAFLDAVSAGDVERGSVLIVESLDRLSRDDARQALAPILKLLEHEITIVTLSGGSPREISPGIEYTDLVGVLFEQARAHNESRQKSARGRDAWSRKRRHALDRPLTRKVPLWLRVTEDGSTIEVVPERAKVVQEIFDLAVAGFGRRAIARTLNERGVPTWGGGTIWHASYVGKLLRSRATIGEFQPRERIRIPGTSKKVSQPSGPPVLGYFPAVVKVKQFNAVNSRRPGKSQPPPGRKGRRFSNLFIGLGKCRLCRSSMVMVNKGRNPKSGGRYLVCSRGLGKAGCSSVHWRYQTVEEAILRHCDEIDFANLVELKAQRAEVKRLEEQSEEAEEELARIEDRIKQINKLLGDLGQEIDADEVADALRDLNEKKATARARRVEIEQMQGEIEDQLRPKRLKKAAREAINGMSSMTSEQAYQFRSRLNQELRRVLAEIHFDPIGPAENAPTLEPESVITLVFRSGARSAVLPELDYAVKTPPKAK